MEDQIISAAKDGHNFMILGQAGTGKSHMIGQIKQVLSSLGKVVQVTASTGVAASVVNGMTINKFCGILDGRFTNSVVVDRLIKSVDYNNVRQRLVDTDTLVIDEISMLSAKTFGQIEHVIRNVRGDKHPDCLLLPFGGMQVILAGDFYQLRPVPNIQYGDQGQSIIEDDSIHVLVPHKFVLTKVHRQEQVDLVQAVHELSKGEISTNTHNLIKRLDRKLPPGKDPIRLFGRNYEVEMCNSEELLKMDGDAVEFKAEDNGVSKYLSTSQALKTVYLKVGAPVILVVNLDDDLFNGAQGTVVRIDNDSVDVKFAQKTVTICKHRFDVYNPHLNKVVASRYQIPLRLSFALTVHRAQGLSLDRVVVDCTSITMPGHISVAVGRATSKKGLQIINFSKKCLRKQPPYVSHFYDAPSISLQTDKLCCLKSVKNCDVESIPSPVEISEDIVDNVEMLISHVQQLEDTDCDDDFCIAALDAAETASQNIELNTTGINLDLEDFLSKAHIKEPLTRSATELNKLYSSLESKMDHVSVFADKINSMVTQLVPTSNASVAHTKFYGEVSKIPASDEYKSALCDMFSVKELDKIHWKIGFTILEKVRSSIIANKAQTLKDMANDIAEKNVPEYTSSAAGASKIRYIGGWCVASLKFQRIRRLRQSLYKENAKSTATALNADIAKLSNLELVDIEESTDPQSLHETERRQSVKRSLCNITDSAYDFFKNLDIEVRKKETTENLNIHGHLLYTRLFDDIVSNSTLCEKWVGLVGEDTVSSLYSEVVRKFIFMSSAQFRRDFKRKVSAKKVEAHRKQIMMRSDSKGRSSTSVWSIDSAIKDSSTCKIATHRRLQSEVEMSSTFFCTSLHKVAHLKKLAAAYGLKIPSNASKLKLNDKLVNEIKSKNEISHPEVLCDSAQPIANVSPSTVSDPVPSTSAIADPQPGTSGLSDPQPGTSGLQGPQSGTVELQDTPVIKKGKGRGRKRKKLILTESPCGICQKECSSSFTRCNTCSVLFHHDCTGETVNEGEFWECPNCNPPYPCGICKRNCPDSCVECERCLGWFHFECLGRVVEDSESWFCAKCAT